jgi:hypothetical protein
MLWRCGTRALLTVFDVSGGELDEAVDDVNEALENQSRSCYVP